MADNKSVPDAKSGAKAQAAADKAYRKASRPWFKKKRFLFPLIIVAIIVITIVANAGKKEPAPSVNSSPPASAAAPATEAAAAFPGAKKGDVVGQAGAALKIGDATVTSAPIANGDATFAATLCTATTLSNGSKETINFNAFDWKLQTPSGTIVTTGFSGSKNMLSSGEIAPGGTASGDVCFDNKNAESGQFVVLYQPVFSFFSDRAAWINNH
ncbi:DUF4352 domain-containing protein [Micrococcaceae bacterium Sec5.7]